MLVLEAPFGGVFVFREFVEPFAVIEGRENTSNEVPFCD